MKQALTLLAVAITATGAGAQTLNVVSGDVTYAIPSTQTGEMTFNNGVSVTILGKTYDISAIDKMFVDDTEVTDNTVAVTYQGSTAKVTISGNIARYVSATVEGAHVTLIQSDEVGDATCGEITYQLSGESDNGSLYMEGAYKASFELLGLTLTNPEGSPLDIQDGKRIDMSVKSGTVNTLRDGANGAQKGALVCKGHLELKGKGQLDVYGNTAHGVYAKEYIEMKNCTLNVRSSLKDGINCTQYFLMESGELNITNVADDGIQVDFKDSTDREAEDTGCLTINGGTINIATTGIAVKGLKAEADVLLNGGDITITSAGNGYWDTSKSKTKAAACVGADADIIINGSVLHLSASGSGGKGISCDGVFTMESGEVEITTTGGVFAYVNGTEYHNYTGSTDRIDSDYKSSPKGIKADTEIIINNGTILTTTKGNGGEGIESKGTLTINGGDVTVNAYDDAINSSSHMYINGGNVTVVATNNDGLDSNGNLYIRGGVVRAFGAGSPECGIDANEEQGYSVIFTGGMLLSVGGSNSTPSSSESTQAYVSGSGSVTANSVITLKSGDTELATFTVPSNYNSSSSSSGGGMGGWGGPGGGMGGMGGGSILISCPGLTSGSSYTLVNGSSSSNVTAALKGGSSGGRPW